MPDLSEAVSEVPEGIVIAIEVTAGAKEASFPHGYNEWRRTIGCRVPDPALDGRANKAAIRLIAVTLGVPVSSISILSGAAASQKRVLVAGMSSRQILDRLILKK